MNITTSISDKWIKASIIGTIWAAAEIVLGSFLHNLRVPFSGNILTAIALVILISLSYKWREYGLYWRAGIICAIMKTMSPSAVIFGPMIAIVIESLLLEISVRLLGRTFIGFIAGSMLAMSWNLFQKIITLVIFYGGNLVDLYSRLTDYTARQLSLKFNTFWAPILLLLSLYAVFGAASAIVGMRTGRKIISRPAETIMPVHEIKRPGSKKEDKPFDYSLFWLAADILLVAGSLVILSLTRWMYWIIAVAPVVALLTLRYKRAMRQLSRPGFWITFVVLTMLSALAFTVFQSGTKDIAAGLLIGIQMNFRAVIIIVGFSALGTELYNPVIRNLFSRTHLRQLPLALELSAASLPSMIADMPDLKTAIKDPVSIISRMMARVEKRLGEVRGGQDLRPQAIIISGGVGEGKTTALHDLVATLKARGITAGGILAPRIIENGITTGYDILNIRSGIRTPFMRLAHPEIAGVERFTIYDKGHNAGLQALDPDNNSGSDVVIIDEAGPLELRGEGWSGRISELLEKTDITIIVAVRKALVGKVMERFGIIDALVFEQDNHADRGIFIKKITDSIVKNKADA
jgi:nucleoside-triphosphatase THEP1